MFVKGQKNFFKKSERQPIPKALFLSWIHNRQWRGCWKKPTMDHNGRWFPRPEGAMKTSPRAAKAKPFLGQTPCSQCL